MAASVRFLHDRPGFHQRGMKQISHLPRFREDLLQRRIHFPAVRGIIGGSSHAPTKLLQAIDEGGLQQRTPGELLTQAVVKFLPQIFHGPGWTHR